MDKKEPKREKDLVQGCLAEEFPEADRKPFDEGLEKDRELTPELEEAMEIKRAFEHMEREVSVPSDEIFERICSRIAEEDSAYQEGRGANKAPNPFKVFIRQLRGLFYSPGFAWGFCVAQAIVFLFAFFVFGTSRPQFETMSFGEQQQNGPVYNIIFKSNLQFGDVVAFLEKHHLKIVDGPSKKGLFVVKAMDKKDLEEVKKSRFLDFIAPAY